MSREKFDSEIPRSLLAWSNNCVTEGKVLINALLDHVKRSYPDYRKNAFVSLSILCGLHDVCTAKAKSKGLAPEQFMLLQPLIQALMVSIGQRKSRGMMKEKYIEMLNKILAVWKKQNMFPADSIHQWKKIVSSLVVQSTSDEDTVTLKICNVLELLLKTRKINRIIRLMAFAIVHRVENARKKGSKDRPYFASDDMCYVGVACLYLATKICSRAGSIPPIKHYVEGLHKAMETQRPHPFLSLPFEVARTTDEVKRCEKILIQYMEYDFVFMIPFEHESNRASGIGWCGNWNLDKDTIRKAQSLFDHSEYPSSSLYLDYSHSIIELSAIYYHLKVSNHSGLIKWLYQVREPESLFIKVSDQLKKHTRFMAQYRVELKKRVATLHASHNASGKAKSSLNDIAQQPLQFKSQIKSKPSLLLSADALGGSLSKKAKMDLGDIEIPSNYTNANTATVKASVASVPVLSVKDSCAVDVLNSSCASGDVTEVGDVAGCSDGTMAVYECLTGSAVVEAPLPKADGMNNEGCGEDNIIDNHGNLDIIDSFSDHVEYDNDNLNDDDGGDVMENDMQVDYQEDVDEGYCNVDDSYYDPVEAANAGAGTVHGSEADILPADPSDGHEEYDPILALLNAEGHDYTELFSGDLTSTNDHKQPSYVHNEDTVVQECREPEGQMPHSTSSDTVVVEPTGGGSHADGNRSRNGPRADGSRNSFNGDSRSYPNPNANEPKHQLQSSNNRNQVGNYYRDDRNRDDRNRSNLGSNRSNQQNNRNGDSNRQNQNRRFSSGSDGNHYSRNQSGNR